jgi:hypothetical protein
MSVCSKLPLFVFLLLAAQFSQAQTPTWSDDVANIVYNKCSSCHHIGGAGPFSLMTYSETASNSSNILYAVSNDLMPPWPPDTNYRRLAHERVLTPLEKQQLTDWITAGAPEGNPANAPAPPVFSSQSQIATTADIAVRMPDYTITSTLDEYRCFVLPSGTTADRFITAMELIPGNRSAVHHVLIFQDETGAAAQLDAQDPAPGYTSFGGIGVNGAELIGAWVPGSSPHIFPNGMGIRLKAGADVVLQIHYPSGVTGQADSTRLYLKTTSSNLREVFIASPLNHGSSLTNGPLVIPPNMISTFNNSFSGVPYPLSILGVAPHMHLLGKSIKAFGVSPSNDTIPFIRINHWRFHWQGMYNFRYLVKLPANSSLYGEASYDNTTNNPWNPNSPPATVTLGEGTTDEMFLVYFTYTLYQPGDENILQDSSILLSNYPGQEISQQLTFYPNPSNGKLWLSFPTDEGNNAVCIYSTEGRFILQKQAGNSAKSELDLSGLPAGIYILEMRNGTGIRRNKLIINNGE